MEPKIFVANLTAYVEGVIIGKWIDANQDVEDLKKEIQEILDEYPSEEYFITDFEDFGAISIGEYESLEKISALANALVEHGEALSLFYEHHIDKMNEFDIDEIVSEFKEDFIGEYEDLDEFIEGFLDENLPKELEKFELFGNSITTYLDFDQIKRNMESSGDYDFHEYEGNYFVFQNF